MKDQLRAWKAKTDADPLIEKIRRLEASNYVLWDFYKQCRCLECEDSEDYDSDDESSDEDNDEDSEDSDSNEESSDSRSAILHCIVTDIENSRMKDQLRAWKAKTDADPLIKKIRKLEITHAVLMKKYHECRCSVFLPAILYDQRVRDWPPFVLLEFKGQQRWTMDDIWVAGRHGLVTIQWPKGSLSDDESSDTE